MIDITLLLFGHLVSLGLEQVKPPFVSKTVKEENKSDKENKDNDDANSHISVSEASIDPIQ